MRIYFDLASDELRVTLETAAGLRDEFLHRPHGLPGLAWWFAVMVVWHVVVLPLAWLSALKIILWDTEDLRPHGAAYTSNVPWELRSAPSGETRVSVAGER